MRLIPVLTFVLGVVVGILIAGSWPAFQSFVRELLGERQDRLRREERGSAQNRQRLEVERPSSTIGRQRQARPSPTEHGLGQRDEGDLAEHPKPVSEGGASATEQGQLLDLDRVRSWLRLVEDSAWEFVRRDKYSSLDEAKAFFEIAMPGARVECAAEIEPGECGLFRVHEGRTGLLIPATSKPMGPCWQALDEAFDTKGYNRVQPLRAAQIEAFAEVEIAAGGQWHVRRKGRIRG